MTKPSEKSSDQKQLTAFAAALFFSFNLLFFAPMEIYLYNLKDLPIPSKYVLAGCIPICLIAAICLFFILYKMKEKLFPTAVSVVWGLGLAFYIQGNFLQISAQTLDGTEQRAGLLSCIINMLIWLAVLAAPHLIYKFKKDILNNAVIFSSLAIILIESIVLGITCYQAAVNDNTGDIIERLSNNNYDYYLSQNDQYEFSNDHNIIMILTDEYDSFCFDEAVQRDPQAAEGFKDFTFYRNSLGTYNSSSASITNIFTGSHTDTDFSNDLLFRTLDSNGYKIQLFASKEIFSNSIFMTYADNYVEYTFGAKDLLNLDKCLYSLAFYKYMPEFFKEPFHITGAQINKMTSSSDSYYRAYDYDNLAFYNTIDSEVSFTDSKCFKYIYLFGLHPIRTTAKDLQYHDGKTVSEDECAEALNKILCAYLEKLRENGVYDNSDIIILADHGFKDHDCGKYPTLLVKRSGETSDSMRISNAPVSYEDIYPTLLYLSGDENIGGTIFELTEDEERVRYYSGTDEYISGPIR